MLSMEDNIRPPFSPEDARGILASCYGIRAHTVTPLPSELDRNFQLTSDHDERFVLKIAHSSVSQGVLDLQNQTLRHLGEATDLFPRLIPARDGGAVIVISGADGRDYRARLLSFIEGIPLRDFRPHSPALLGDIGARLAQVSAALQDFDHDEKRLDYRWNIRNLPRVAAYAGDMPADKRALLDYFLALVADELLPALPDLRCSFVYNDANDTNILVRAHQA